MTVSSTIRGLSVYKSPSTLVDIQSIIAPIPSWQGTIQLFLRPTLAIYHVSTIGAHKIFRLKGHVFSEKKPTSENDTPRSLSIMGITPERPIGNPCKVYNTSKIRMLPHSPCKLLLSSSSVMDA